MKLDRFIVDEPITTSFMVSGAEYLIDIVELPGTIEVWLYHPEYAIKEMLFGIPKEQEDVEHSTIRLYDVDSVLEMVEAYDLESAIASYKENYED